MRVRATVVLRLETREIMSITYHDVVLNRGIGGTRIKNFIKKKVLQMPIQEFRIETNFKAYPRLHLMVTDIELDVYPIIKKADNCVMKRDVLYRCILYPLPKDEESDITYDEYHALVIKAICEKDLKKSK